MTFDVTSLRDQLTAEFERADFSGIVRIDEGRSTILEMAAGFATRRWSIPNSPSVRYDTASMTKLFTAVAAMQQIEKGGFAVDTPVIPYLGLEGTTISNAVTPFHLLTHTSGIADDADEEAGERYDELFIDHPNYGFTNTADCLPNFIHKPPNFAPGEGCRYCNVGYVLLGLMVERATGSTFRDYVRANVFESAGMETAGFFRMDGEEPNVAEGLVPITDANEHVVEWRRNIYSYPPIGSPDGGAHVTAEDMFRFHRALVDGELVAPDSLAQMLTPHALYDLNGETNHWVGFGFEMRTNADGSIRSYWKEGINLGVSGMLRHYPAHDLTVVTLSNTEDGAWKPLRIIDAAVV